MMENKGDPLNRPTDPRKLTIMVVLAGTLAIFMALTIASATTSLRLGATAAALLEEQPRALAANSDLKDLEGKLISLDATLSRYMATVNADDKKAFDTGVETANVLLDKIKKQNGAGAEALATAFQAWVESATKSLRVMSVLPATEEARQQFTRELDVYLKGVIGKLAADREASAHRLQNAAHLQIGVLVLSLLLSIVIAYVLHRILVAPLRRLIAVTRELAQGQTTVDLKRKFSLRDFADLQDALRVFHHNAIEREELALAQAREVAAKQTRAQSVDHLITNFDGKVRDTLKRLVETAHALTEGSAKLTEVSQSASKEAQGADRIADELSKAVSVLISTSDEIEASVREISRSAGLSQEASERAVEQAQQMKTAMDELRQLASDIGAILDLIKGLASQTNLLALNATIEAARAGEVGKGFAVVAAEVKTLAAQSANAANEIADKIAAIQDASERTMSAIDRVDAIVRESSSYATSVASAVSQQSSAISTMTSGLTETAGASQESAMGVTRVRDAVRMTEDIGQLVQEHAAALNSESERLRGEIRQFLDGVRAA